MGPSARRGTGRLLLTFLLGTSISVAVQDDPAPGDPRVDEGRFLYVMYCQSCHGPSGRGDGPVAEELRTSPADLTTIQARHGGEFPSEAVHERIDGRSEIGAHGPGDMPVWGYAFQEPGADQDQEAAVRERIAALVAYLRSIQVEGTP